LEKQKAWGCDTNGQVLPNECEGPSIGLSIAGKKKKKKKKIAKRKSGINSCLLIFIIQECFVPIALVLLGFIILFLYWGLNLVHTPSPC
jgi:hypothetical protein